MENYLLLADGVARHHHDLIADADHSRRARLARRARHDRRSGKPARARRG
jgi:hypothetical protein